jgi:hypothetical protein
VFGRYVLPLMPILCLLSAAAVFALLGRARRTSALSGRPRSGRCWGSRTGASRRFHCRVRAVAGSAETPGHADHRGGVAAANAAKDARLAVENSGPTYLGAGRFRVLPVELLFEHDAAWYRQRSDYLVISSSDLSRYGDLLGAGQTVFRLRRRRSGGDRRTDCPPRALTAQRTAMAPI